MRAPEPPVTKRHVAAMLARPGLRSAIERYAAADLARYRSLSLIERWLISDMGRTSLSGAAVLLEAAGRLTAGALLASIPVASGEVSRGRARLYLERAMANGLILAQDGGSSFARDTPLVLSPRFLQVTTGMLADLMQITCEVAPGAELCADLNSDPGAARQLATMVSVMLADLRNLFPLDSPIRLFQDRDGGARMLDALILLQPPDRGRLLTSCEISHSALARAGFCSRIHAIRLLRDGQAQNLLSHEGRRLTIAPELSDDVERYLAGTFAVIYAAVAALGRG